MLRGSFDGGDAALDYQPLERTNKAFPRLLRTRLRHGLRASSSLAVGAASLVLLLGAEWAAGVWLQGRSFADYVADRDPVSGAVYALMLLVVALMPWVAAGRQRR